MNSLKQIVYFKDFADVTDKSHHINKSTHKKKN